jgi:hypothetical protein
VTSQSFGYPEAPPVISDALKRNFDISQLLYNTMSDDEMMRKFTYFQLDFHQCTHIFSSSVMSVDKM